MVPHRAALRAPSVVGALPDAARRAVEGLPEAVAPLSPDVQRGFLRRGFPALALAVPLRRDAARLAVLPVLAPRPVAAARVALAVSRVSRLEPDVVVLWTERSVARRTRAPPDAAHSLRAVRLDERAALRRASLPLVALLSVSRAVPEPVARVARRSRCRNREAAPKAARLARRRTELRAALELRALLVLRAALELWAPLLSRVQRSRVVQRSPRQEPVSAQWERPSRVLVPHRLAARNRMQQPATPVWEPPPSQARRAVRVWGAQRVARAGFRTAHRLQSENQTSLPRKNQFRQAFSLRGFFKQGLGSPLPKQGNRMRNKLGERFMRNWVHANFRDIRACSRPTPRQSCL